MDAPADVEHRVIESEVLNYHTGSERLTCACGWSGHRSRWMDLDHAARGGAVPRLPSTVRPPVPRDVLRRAIYGDRRR